jgi:hypothetical protein
LLSRQVSSADKRDYQARLTAEKAAARRAASRGASLLSAYDTAPLDHYRLLGVERAASSDDVSGGWFSGVGGCQACLPWRLHKAPC